MRIPMELLKCEPFPKPPPEEQTAIVRFLFHVNPPDRFTLAFHKDWIDACGGASLLEPQTFRYRDIDFEAIAKATRG